MVSERAIQAYLRAQVLRARGLFRKVRWVGRRGAPDTYIVLRRRSWVEVKTQDGVVEPHQEREHQALRDAGEPVAIVRSFSDIDILLEQLNTED